MVNINLPLQPKVIKKEGDKAVFEIEDLYPGYGVTLGNSLRRVLLSSLSGAAATQVKIKGVSHEFSTVSGILEDVIMIMTNLKGLRFKIFTEEPQIAKLSVRGEKEVTGADLKLPPQLELINRDCHIATLTQKTASLEMEITVEKGIGYSSRESRKTEKLEIGAIALDAIFTPVKRVSYRVENMRVGDRTDYDRLFLEIETDGIISPQDAFYQASEILVNHFSLLKDAFVPKVEAKETEKEKTKPASKRKAPKEKKEKHAKNKKGKKI